MIITIDGPSGAGKSSVSRQVARKLGFAFLDTGALYRGVALAANWEGVSPDDEPVVEAWLTRVDLTTRVSGGRFAVLLDGRDIEPFIRNQRIAQLASKLSAQKAVRTFLLETQRKAAEGQDLVAEGRDMGTVVFPRAEAKFFLTASPEIRAQRRLLELKPEKPGLTLNRVLKELEQRDERDAGRKLSPLRPAPDAEVVDTSEMTLEQVVDFLIERVGDKRGN